MGAGEADLDDYGIDYIPAVAAGGAAAFKSVAEVHSTTLPNAGGTLSKTVIAAGGPCLILCYISFQSTVSQGYQHNLQDNGGPNLLLFKGAFSPTTIAAHTNAPVEMHMFMAYTTLTAGSHTLLWTLSQAIGTTGNNLVVQMVILYT